MKILVVANQKGGVGKTASAVNIGFFAHENVARTLFIDLDPQQNATSSLRDFHSGVRSSQLFSDRKLTISDVGDGSMRVIMGDDALTDLDATLSQDVAMQRFADRLAELGSMGFDLCVIDTAPALGIAMTSALMVADFVLSPVEMEAFSLQGIEKMITTIGNIKQYNKGLEFLGMMPSKVDTRNAQQVSNEAELRSAYPELVTPVTNYLRTAIPEALSQGIPVWNIKRTAARKAAKEVRAVSEFVCKKMEIM